MANSSQQDREDLHKALWAMACDCRGAVDGWTFRKYVLGMIFYRYASESVEKYFDGFFHIDFRHYDGEKIGKVWRTCCVRDLGFYIRPSDLFDNVCEEAMIGLTDAVQTMTDVFGRARATAAGTEHEEKVRTMFDTFDDAESQLGPTVDIRNRIVTRLLLSVRRLNLSGENDVFGDAYEYLMSMYASNAGKAGGEYFTPPEVSELMAQIVIDGDKTLDGVYDPTCGSGSLLLKVVQRLGPENVGRICGQELNPTSRALAMENLLVHGVPIGQFDIALGDVLKAPAHR